MQGFHIADELRERLPDAVFGLLAARVAEVPVTSAPLSTMMAELCERLRFEYAGKVAADRPEVAATRRAYRALGDDPTRYRPANEALLRRVLSHRALPQIHVLVDVNNFVSLESGFALGCYDLSKIEGDVTVRRSAPGEHYEPIGKPTVEAGSRLVLADTAGIFGSPTADSQRTMVTQETRDVLFVVFGFETTHERVERAVNRSAVLLERFCAAQVLERQII